jgi:hypothetical protein
MCGTHFKGMRGKSDVRYCLILSITSYLLNIKLFKSKKFFIRPNITTSNAHAFKEFLRPVSLLPNSTTSWCMHIIYTSKGVMKMLGCALSIEKYGTFVDMLLSVKVTWRNISVLLLDHSVDCGGIANHCFHVFVFRVTWTISWKKRTIFCSSPLCMEARCWYFLWHVHIQGRMSSDWSS